MAQLFVYGEMGDRSQGSGIAYSFATDRKGGFSDDDTTLVQATLPALSLAMKAHAGHVIASGLLGAYLGEDAGRRVHAGSIMRGSVDNLRAVIWYADIRGFTPLSDTAPGPVVVELLNEIFEILTASLRERGGQVLKFIGDAMLAIFPFEDADRAETCRRALDAAIEAMGKIEALSAARVAAGGPAAPVDLALHLGDVLYGNVGAIDRLDFTVIGPAINEVARIEALCQPLGRAVLVSAEFMEGMKGADSRLKSLAGHALRGVKERKEIFALEVGAKGSSSPSTTPKSVVHSIVKCAFDPVKDALNQEKHQVSLALAEVCSMGRHTSVGDSRFDYRETRQIAFGFINSRLFVCVYTDRDDERRVISLRKANSREVKRYGEKIEKAAREALRKTDWRRVDAMTDADITRQIAAHADAAPDMAPDIDVRAIREAIGMTRSSLPPLMNSACGQSRSGSVGPSGRAGQRERFCAPSRATPKDCERRWRRLRSASRLAPPVRLARRSGHATRIRPRRRAGITHSPHPSRIPARRMSTMTLARCSR